MAVADSGEVSACQAVEATEFVWTSWFGRLGFGSPLALKVTYAVIFRRQAPAMR